MPAEGEEVLEGRIRKVLKDPVIEVPEEDEDDRGSPQEIQLRVALFEKHLLSQL